MAQAKYRLYKVAMDWWILVPIFIGILVLVGAVPFVIFRENIPLWQQIGATLVLIFMTLYLVDTAFFTYYQLTPNGLIIVSQLRYFHFPYRNMTEVRSIGMRGLFSFRKRKRFALSLHSYQITVHGGAWKYITVSPAERDTFMNHLMEHVDQERSARATKH